MSPARQAAPTTLTLSAMFFVQLAETAAEAERLRAAIAARYGLAPHDAAGHPLLLGGTVGELRERLAERVARLDWATWCSSARRRRFSRGSEPRCSPACAD